MHVCSACIHTHKTICQTYEETSAVTFFLFLFYNGTVSSTFLNISLLKIQSSGQVYHKVSKNHATDDITNKTQNLQHFFFF